MTNEDKHSLWDLAYWQSGEYQVVEERLDDYEKNGVAYVPTRKLLFRSIELLAPDQVRCVILGQDPYPNPQDATGTAFSVSGHRSRPLPGTLINIFKEYQADLHYPAPKNGDLTPWVKQGVLLWNAYPSCLAWKPGSNHWSEWRPLTTEILEKLDATTNNLCFVLLGAIARNWSSCIHNNPVIETSHPSPLGARHGFYGSRLFSHVNAELVKINKEPIDWVLPCEEKKLT